MPNIEINTAQNVQIDYELASVAQRGFAFLIDYILIMLGLFIMFISLSNFLFSGSESSILLGQIILFCWISFYSLASELIGNGQTLGKWALGIKVMKLNGEELQFYDYFSRWSMRLIDIYLSLGSIAVLLIASNKNGQRLGDIIAGTSVVRKKSHYGFALGDIARLNLKTRENSEFLYPNAVRLKEKDVILIKHLLYRLKLFDNKAHREALDLLCIRVAAVIGLEKAPSDKQVFLNKVVSEYIILTR